MSYRKTLFAVKEHPGTTRNTLKKSSSKVPMSIPMTAKRMTLQAVIQAIKLDLSTLKIEVSEGWLHLNLTKLVCFEFLMLLV